MARTGRLTPADRVLAAVGEHLPQGEFTIALSGGPDSAAAAWAVSRLAGRPAVDAVHVHHGGAASDTLAAAAAEVAALLDIPLHRVDVAVPPGASFEGSARIVRLDALERAAGPERWIVTGHHADDSTETVLANLLRGAGATGLSGIAVVRGRWVRPLLAIPRDVVRAAADELALPYADDPANIDRRHRRNVIRHDVLPWLEERLGAPVRRVVARSARHLAADDAELARIAAAVPVVERYGAIAVSAAVLASVPPPIAARAARRALRAAHPPYPGSAADVAAVLSVAAGGADRLQLSAGFHAVREGADVVIYDRGPDPLEPVPVGVPGSVDVGWWRLSIGPPDAYPPVSIGPWRVRAAATALAGEVVARSAVPGERIDLPGGSKPVREVMREAGIAPRLRPAWPVLAVDAKIAWVAGARPARWVLAGPDEPSVVLAIEGIRR